MFTSADSSLTKMIIDSMSEGLFAVDKDFKIRMFNKSAERITGFSSKEVLGKFCKFIFRSDHCLHGCPLRLTLEGDKNLDGFETDIQMKNNQRKMVQVNTAILREQGGQPVGGIVTFKEEDVSKIIKEKIDSSADFDGMVGKHSSMRKIFKFVETMAASDENIFITGESGTGKELLANAIKMRSKRHEMPYIKVNCSVSPETLIASELFGHVKGAFTGATQDRVGRFEMAHDGTLMLDEVCEIPMPIQAKILRVIEDGIFERVGDSLTRYSNVRIIAATNKVIDDEVASGAFRNDLFYRLNVIPVHLPPLRERRSDIPHLIQFFINKYNIETGKKIEDIEDSAVGLLMKYDWPGNIRQLENALNYAFSISSSRVIQADSFPIHIQNAKGSASSPKNNNGKHSSGNIEKDLLLKALEENQWSKTKTSKALGIGRTSLWRKMKNLNIEP